MDKCNVNCKHMKLFEDKLKGYEKIETNGYCEKHKKIVYFADECPDYEPKKEQKQ